MATVNRIFQCVRRAYNLAGVPWPDFQLPSEAGNIRQGFLSPAQMDKVLDNLPDDGPRDFIRFGYSTGTRRNEVANLTWAMVDGDEPRIPGDICKNRELRVLPLTGELGSIIKRRKAAQSFKLDGGVQLSNFIFHRQDGKPKASGWGTGSLLISVS